jgi:hypothetical protein
VGRKGGRASAPLYRLTPTGQRAVFALVEAVLVRPLAFPEPDRLMLIWEASGSAPTLRGNVAPGNYRDWQAQGRTFDDVAAFGSIALNQEDIAAAEEHRAGLCEDEEDR